MAQRLKLLERAFVPAGSYKHGHVRHRNDGVGWPVRLDYALQDEQAAVGTHGLDNLVEQGDALLIRPVVQHACQQE